MTPIPHHLLDPLAYLDMQEAQFDWDGHDALRLDDRYRQRQLPLLRETPRPPLSADELSPAEYWPPVRSAVIPIDDAALRADPGFAAFLADVRDAVAPAVWWPGLRLRGDRVHATLAPDLGLGAELSGGPLAAVDLTVRGPWVGRVNTGRIYLPVQAADAASARQLEAVRVRLAAAHRPLLAGYLQLTDDICGEQYAALRDLVGRHQTRVQVPVTPAELWQMDTMDDLVLRSHVGQRVPFSAPPSVVVCQGLR